MLFNKYENSREFDLLALAEAKAAIVESLEVAGGLRKIHFFEGVLDQSGPAETQDFYWRAVLEDRTIRRGHIRLDYSNYEVEIYNGWEMSDTDREVVPGWAFPDEKEIFGDRKGRK